MMSHSGRRTGRAGAAGTLLMLVAGLLFAGRSDAQTSPASPTVFYACYNKGTGTVYRIKELSTPQNCTSSQHVQFSWTDGIAGNDHGALSGLSNDDHPQYLLAGGTRALAGHLSAGGFKLTGLGAAAVNGDAIRFEQGIKMGDAAGGDLGGTFPNPSVQKLQGREVSSTAPDAGQVLTWNDGLSRWEPASGGGVTGWEVVRANNTTTNPLPAQGHLVLHALCPAGKKAVGGGFSTSDLSSYPVENSLPLQHLSGWSARFRNNTNVDASEGLVSTWAVCVTG